MGKGGKYAVECISDDIISKKCLPAQLRFFANQKIFLIRTNSKLEILRKSMF